MTGNYYEEKTDKVLEKISIGILIFVAIFAVALFSLIGVFIGTYNNIVDLQEDVSYAKTNVVTMLQRRLAIIPDFVSTVEDYAELEEQIVDDVISARESLSKCLKDGELSEISDANENLTSVLNNLITVAEENSPELKSSEYYISLMNQLEWSDSRISIACEKYNESVSIYNGEIGHIPGSIFASIFGFSEEEMFKSN